MTEERVGLGVAYLNYGTQSGVTAQVTAGLAARGHRVTPLVVPGPLEPRDAAGRRRFDPRIALQLAASALQFGPRAALAHRWNTGYAFDVHTRRAGALLAGLAPAPDVVLQNGALFAAGVTPPAHVVLLLDHTRALSMERPPVPEAGLAAPLDYGPGWKERETLVYRRARAIATFSRRVAESLQRDYGVPGERIHVVGAGANLLPAQPVRADDGRTIVFVGKDFRRKGGAVLVRAFQRLRARRPDARLLVVGPRERLDLPEGATNLGLVPPAQLTQVLSTATLFVLPTLREPFGLAFLDAMACGLPCVGTLVEAVPEIVRQGETGLLVPAGDDAALTDAMEALLASPERARAFGEAGRQRVLDAGFTWDAVAARLEETFTPTRDTTPAATPTAASVA